MTECHSLCNERVCLSILSKSALSSLCLKAAARGTGSLIVTNAARGAGTLSTSSGPSFMLPGQPTGHGGRPQTWTQTIRASFVALHQCKLNSWHEHSMQWFQAFKPRCFLAFTERRSSCVGSQRQALSRFENGRASSLYHSYTPRQQFAEQWSRRHKTTQEQQAMTKGMQSPHTKHSSKPMTPHNLKLPRVLTLSTLNSLQGKTVQ